MIVGRGLVNGKFLLVRNKLTNLGSWAMSVWIDLLSTGFYFLSIFPQQKLRQKCNIRAAFIIQVVKDSDLVIVAALSYIVEVFQGLTLMTFFPTGFRRCLFVFFKPKAAVDA